MASMTERRPLLQRASDWMLLGLSFTALLDVLLFGYLRPPQADEGVGAHIFQLVIVALVPAGLCFVATADWERPGSTMRRLAWPAAVVTLAFAALYYLEHFFYPAHY